MSKIEDLKAQKRITECNLYQYDGFAKDTRQKLDEINEKIAELEKQGEPFPLQPDEWVVNESDDGDWIHRCNEVCDEECQRPAPLWIPIPDDMMEAPNIKGLIAVKIDGVICNDIRFASAFEWGMSVHSCYRITHVLILEDQE